MSTVIRQTKTHKLEMTGTNLMVYASRYRLAAIAWLPTSQKMEKFDPVLYYLFCLSLELHLKSFIWLKDQISWKILKKNYGHNLVKLWNNSKDKGISKYARVTDLRNHVISLVGPYYCDRKFNYLDLQMIHSGFMELKSEPRIIPTLSRLTGQLGHSLRKPILRASNT